MKHVRSVIHKAISKMLVVDVQMSDDEMFVAIKAGKLYDTYLAKAKELSHVGRTLTWAWHQLREEEARLMAQPVRLAVGASNSLASLGQLLPEGVEDLREEMAHLKKCIGMAFDAAESWGRLASDTIE
jgi:hypothetical protein